MQIVKGSNVQLERQLHTSWWKKLWYFRFREKLDPVLIWKPKEKHTFSLWFSKILAVFVSSRGSCWSFAEAHEGDTNVCCGTEVTQQYLSTVPLLWGRGWNLCPPSKQMSLLPHLLPQPTSQQTHYQHSIMDTPPNANRLIHPRYRWRS